MTNTKEAIKLDNESMKDYMQYSDEPEKLDALSKELEVSYVRHGMRKHFQDDTDEREVLTVTVKRGSREIEFEYGLSLVDTEALNLPECRPFDYDGEPVILININPLPKSYRKLFTTKTGKPYVGRYAGKSGTYHSFNGSWAAYTSIKKILRANALKDLLYSVLCSLQSDYHCPAIFEDFCGEFGYDVDSRKAFETWQNCLKQSQKVQSIIFEDEAAYLPA